MNVALGMSPSFSLLRIDLISDSVETQTKLKMSKSCVLSCLVLVLMKGKKSKQKAKRPNLIIFRFIWFIEKAKNKTIYEQILVKPAHNFGTGLKHSDWLTKIMNQSKWPKPFWPQIFLGLRCFRGCSNPLERHIPMFPHKERLTENLGRCLEVICANDSSLKNFCIPTVVEKCGRRRLIAVISMPTLFWLLIHTT